MTGFQASVLYQPNPGVEGAFCDVNPRAVVDAGAGQFVAGNGGAIVGRFAWADSNGLVTNAGVGAPTGFLAREEQALITVYLAETSMVVPVGFPVTLYSRGGFWAKTLTNATIGQKVFANLGTGQISTAAAGSTIANFSGTASFATNVMTVTVASSGSLKVGDVITSAGVAAGTYITSFGTGTGGTGTYNLSTSPGTITAQAVTSTSYVETQWYVTGTGYANGSANTAASGDLIKISTWN